MKKMYLLPFFYLFWLVAGQAQWIPQGQGILPEGYGIIDLSAVDENTIWALSSSQNGNDGNSGGDPEIVIRSVDGGDTWEAHTLAALSARSLVSFSAVSEEVAWISSYDASGTRYFHQTTDGGANWMVKYTIPADPEFSSAPILKFVDENRGYFLHIGQTTDDAGNTSDGGETWSLYSSSNFLSNEWWSTASSQNWLEVVGDTLWYGTSKRIRRSTDGGASWEDSFVDFPGQNIIK